MLTSIALILLLGLLLGSLFSRLKLPSLLGMIIVGIVLGPYALNMIDESILTGESIQVSKTADIIEKEKDNRISGIRFRPDYKRGY